MAAMLQDGTLLKSNTAFRRPNRGRRSALPVILFAAFIFSTDAVKDLSAQSFSPDSGTAEMIEPPIPTYAVANSRNCDHLAHLAGQLQSQIESEDLWRRAPLTPAGKFQLALRNFSDPVNIGGTALDSEISNATSSATSAFGTGWSGFGKRFGMSMADDGLNEFFSTFLVSSIAHQDPHYHRDPGASTGKRIFYALSRVVVARSDSGKPMFNYAEFVGTSSSALLETTYHFERDESPGAISSRIFVSIGSDAAWNLMNEFLPDVAKHVNPRFFFLRRLAEKAAKQN
jgi:hypothetical protein